MAFVQLSLQRVKCFNAETIHGPDYFMCAGSVITERVGGERQVHAFATDLIHTRVGLEEVPNKTLFVGATAGTRIGLVFAAFDMDNNTDWHSNKKDIKKIADDITLRIKDLPLLEDIGKVLGVVADVLYYTIDLIVSADKPDRLGMFTHWFDLPDTLGAERFQPFAIRLRGDDGGIGYSDWLYELTFGCSWSTPPPSFGPIAENNTTWSERQGSAARDWFGNWESQDPNNAVTVSIGPNAADCDLLDVTVLKAGEALESSTGIPISRTYLESATPDFQDDALAVITPEPAVRITPFGLPNLDLELLKPANNVVLERFEGPVAFRQPMIGDLLDDGDIGDRRQLGADYLWLSEFGVLEIYSVEREGNDVGEPGLTYRWPVKNPVLPAEPSINVRLARSVDLN